MQPLEPASRLILPEKPEGLPASLLNSEMEISVWLDQFGQKLEDLAVAYNDSLFNKYIGRATEDLNQIDAALGATLSDNFGQSLVRYWLGKATEPKLQRRLKCLSRAFVEAEVSKNPPVYELRNSINDRLVSYRPTVKGYSLTRSEILEILRTNPDREYRRTIYEQALSPLAAELAPRVQELIFRRNAEAKRLGYANYSELVLENSQISWQDLQRIFAELERQTESFYQKFIEDSCREYGWKRVEAWDVTWIADQRAHLPEQPFQRDGAIPAANQLLQMMGLQPETLPLKIIPKEIPFGGLCFSIKIPTDVRVLCSPKDGYPYYRTMFHEFGHALHAVFNEQSDYLVKREPGSFNEGIAEIMAFFTHSPAWIAEMTALPATEISRYKRENVARRVVRWRSLMAQARFEIEAYQNPDQNLEKLHAELEAYYLRTPLNLTPRWAASSFPTTHPIYRQNYIIGEMIAAQTHATLQNRLGDFFAGDAVIRRGWFEFVRQNYIAPGASLDWPTKIELATGAPLSVSALITELEIQ